MNSRFKRLLGILFITFAFITSNNIITAESLGFRVYISNNTVYASPKRFGGFKSGTFKSNKSSSGGFKSGLFKSSKPKTNGSSNSGSGFFSSGSNSGTKARSFFPFFIPWGGFGHGFGAFSFIKIIFNLILIAIVIMIILRYMRRRR